MPDLSLPPATQKYLGEFYARVFAPLESFSSSILYGLPKSGINSFIKYFLAYGKSPLSPRTDILYLTITLSEDDTYSIFDDILRALQASKDPSVVSFATDASASALLSKVSLTKKIVFIVQNARVLSDSMELLDDLVNLHNINTVFIKFLLIVNEEWPQEVEQNVRVKLGVVNSCYIPLRTSEDINILIKNSAEWDNLNIEESVATRIADLSGGYSALARQLLTLHLNSILDIYQNYELLIKNSALSMWLYLLFSSLSEISKSQLASFLWDSTVEDSEEISFSNFLVETQLVKKKGSDYVLFSELFRAYLINLSKSSDFVSIDNGQLFRFGSDVKSLLSRQEWEVFKLLYDKKNTTVTRDSIADAMWGTVAEEKYSDWAIDKLVHRIRKKLNDTAGKNIKSEKGKGVMLTL